MLERKNKVLSSEDTKALKFTKLWSRRRYINNRKKNHSWHQLWSTYYDWQQSALSSLWYVCVCERVCVYVCGLVAQSCPTLCNSMDCSPPSSSVYGISQTRILQWVVISFSKGSSWLRDWTWVPECLLHRRQILVPLSHWRWIKCKFTSHHSNKILGYIANFSMVCCFTCEFTRGLKKPMIPGHPLVVCLETSPLNFTVGISPVDGRAGLLLGQDWVRPQSICTRSLESQPEKTWHYVSVLPLRIFWEQLLSEITCAFSPGPRMGLALHKDILWTYKDILAMLPVPRSSLRLVFAQCSPAVWVPPGRPPGAP